MASVRTTFSVVAVILGCLIIPPAALNYGGYCFSQGRFLSDEEKIRHVVNYINGQAKVPIQIWSAPEYFENIRYKDEDDFLRQNPNCCAVTFKIPSGDFSPTHKTPERLFGIYGGNVSVKYTAHYRDKSGEQKSAPVQWFVPINNCGYVL
ncbi:MAG TPA: hypothetical protein VL625_02805 [Patescibacteria group bacterium]|nr:hypothetical protein [Patescibacteria group bacterium]